MPKKKSKKSGAAKQTVEKTESQNAVDGLLKKAQKKAGQLVAAARDAAESAKKSAKKAKKSAKKSAEYSSAGSSSAGSSSTGSSSVESSSAGSSSAGPSSVAPPSVAAPEQRPASEAAPAAELPLPTSDDPDTPSTAWTVARLRVAAKERGVTGYGSLRKEQLIAALNATD